MREGWLDHCKVSIGISRRLFLTLLAASLLTAIGVALATRWSFQQGFVAYLDEREVQRIEAIALSLATAWEANRSWDFIRDDGNRQPRPISILEFTADCRTGSALPNGLVLYDKQLRHIAGDESATQANAIRQPISSHGEVVGTLIGTPRRALSTEAELRFQRHQIQTSWAIGLTLAFLAAILAAAVAKSFLTPINALIKGATGMARGNHAVRVPTNRSDEFGTLATCFNVMTETLQGNEVRRQKFMADVSHELRTPLAILHAELEAMKAGIKAADSHGIGSLLEEAHILARLVDDIRQLSSTEDAKLQYDWRELDLAELLEEEHHLWRKQFATTDLVIDVDCHTGLRVRADPDRLRQALRNLIENARRHAAGADRLQFRVRRESDSAVIECHDNGQGIADNQSKHLFHRDRLDDRPLRRDTEGSGLGLAICRRIIVAHGGRIEAEPSILGGLCVRMHLPIIKVET